MIAFLTETVERLLSLYQPALQQPSPSFPLLSVSKFDNEDSYLLLLSNRASDQNLLIGPHQLLFADNSSAD